MRGHALEACRVSVCHVMGACPMGFGTRVVLVGRRAYTTP